MADETDAQLLSLARTELGNRLRAHGVQSHGVGDKRFEGCSIKDLRELIKDLERATGPVARVVRPMDI